MKLPLAIQRGAATVVAVLASVSVAVGATSEPAPWRPYRDATEQNDPYAQPPIVTVAPAQAIQLPVEEVCEPTQLIGSALAEPGLVAPLCDPSCLAGIPSYASAFSPDDPSVWSWRILPAGVIWQSYWAGEHEPRISGAWFGGGDEALLDVALGGRGALLRFGSDGPGRPKGIELQIEGAAFPRLNLDENWDLEAVDYRFGLPLVYGRDRWQYKFSYYHLSAHMGDEFAIRENAFLSRINFSRDALVLATAFYPLPAWRLYAEMGWAFHYDDGSQPWEFQFGVDVAEPGATDAVGTPFVAVNGHLREEHNFGGNVVAQAGWLWRGPTAHTLRTGFHYFNGKSNQFEFYNQFEQQIGGGIWYDY